jgi:hypothetical protein
METIATTIMTSIRVKPPARERIVPGRPARNTINEALIIGIHGPWAAAYVLMAVDSAEWGVSLPFRSCANGVARSGGERVKGKDAHTRSMLTQ